MEKKNPTEVHLYKIPKNLDDMTPEERYEHFGKLADQLLAAFGHLKPTEPPKKRKRGLFRRR